MRRDSGFGPIRGALAALALGIAGPVGAEIVDITPDRADRLPVDLLTGIQFAQNDHGFKRDALYLDLLRPVTDVATPVVVFVLGSGWQPIERERVLPQLTRLAEAGFAVATVDYRGIGEAQFPVPQEDVKRAIRFLRANADSFNIDPDAMALMGNSAGGHIALLAGLSDEDAFGPGTGTGPEDSSAAVQAIAAIYPAIYVDEMAPEGLGLVNQHFGLMAGDPANADAVAPGLPETHIDAGDPPVFLVHGTADPIVPVDQSVRLHDALAGAGVDATLLRVEGLGHSIEDTMTTRQVEEGLVSFFERTLRPGG
ncbi:alpha/beta hydrolase [Mesobaculum littorinae]|uniref:Alpha/beta hydrolase n=1 Tax=Mesobaculum littorinae TaxID=2486419 RepID=A0A438AFF3_9RHOB|nr:alpha/beta hydrolase [Mesobaculum littorinae]RVV97337.1 alpha/beta hydrolase [Mesobaculum littorinae]